MLGLARECAAEFAPVAGAREVSVRLRGPNRVTRGDRLRLKQAVANVLRNAIEAEPARSEVDVALSTDSGVLGLSVRDRGAGLSSTARERLFEPLFTEKSDGLGMGRFVARAIVEAHGGQIVVAGAEPGTRVDILLQDD